MHTDTTMLWKCCCFTPIPLFLSSLHSHHSLLSAICKAMESGVDAVPLQGLLAEPSAASTTPSGLCCPFFHHLPPYYNLQLSNLVLKHSCKLDFEPCSTGGKGPRCFAAAHHHALGMLVPAKLQALPLDKACEAPQSVLGTVQPAMAVTADGECHPCHRRASYLLTA